jgi:hypothetical protein
MVSRTLQNPSVPRSVAKICPMGSPWNMGRGSSFDITQSCVSSVVEALSSKFGASVGSEDQKVSASLTIVLQLGGASDT